MPLAPRSGPVPATSAGLPSLLSGPSSRPALRRVMLAIAMLSLLPGLPLSQQAAAQVLPAPPDAAAPEDEGFGESLMQEGAKLFLRGLMSEVEPSLDEMGQALSDLGPTLREMGPQLRQLVEAMGDVSAYAMPEKLPNGDILIRRKQPLTTSPEPPAPEPPILPPKGRGDTRPNLVPGPDGAIDL